MPRLPEVVALDYASRIRLAHGIVREWIELIDNAEQEPKTRSSYWKEAPTWLYVFQTAFPEFFKIGIAFNIRNRISSPECAALYAEQKFKVMLPTRRWALAVEAVILHRTIADQHCHPDLRYLHGWTEVRKIDLHCILNVAVEVSESALSWKKPIQSWLESQRYFDDQRNQEIK